MATTWKLKSFLEAHNLNANAVSERTKGKLSRNSLYNLLKSNPRSVRLDTLDTLIPTLEAMTGRSVSVTDLLEYEPLEDDLDGPFTALIGLFGESSAPTDMSAAHDEYIGAALQEQLGKRRQ